MEATKTINFASETEESLTSRGITQLDFIRDFAGTQVVATEIQSNLYELEGAECQYALLTNGDTVYGDNLSSMLWRAGE